MLRRAPDDAMALSAMSQWNPDELDSLIMRSAKRPFTLRLARSAIARSLRQALYHRQRKHHSGVRVTIRVAGRTIRIEPQRQLTLTSQQET